MLPINDTQPNRYSRFPFMTLALIITCTIITIWEMQLQAAHEEEGALYMLFGILGVVPKFILERQGGGALTAITVAFLHADYGHLIGNMFMLWIFGRRVEDACGPWRFLGFYLVASAFASIFYVLIRYNSIGPAVGASGAVMGIAGAYMLLYPGGRIRVFVPVLVPVFFLLPLFFKLRAFWVILYFLAFDIIPAYMAYIDPTFRSGIANWAHIGGFLSAALVLFFLRPEAYQRFINNLPV